MSHQYLLSGNHWLDFRFGTQLKFYKECTMHWQIRLAHWSYLQLLHCLTHSTSLLFVSLPTPTSASLLLSFVPPPLSQESSSIESIGNIWHDVLEVLRINIVLIKIHNSQLELKRSEYWIGGLNWDRIELNRIGCKKIGYWIVGFMKMQTALNFVNIFEINWVACSTKMKRAENVASQLVITAFRLERSVVPKLYTSKQSKSELFNHPSSVKFYFPKQ